MSVDKSPGTWKQEQGKWLHRPCWKVAANTLLRLVQRGRFKWVFYSVCKIDSEGERPRAVGYGFGKIEHLQ